MSKRRFAKKSPLKANKNGEKSYEGEISHIWDPSLEPLKSFQIKTKPLPLYKLVDMMIWTTWIFILVSHRIHVWYVCLHLVDFYGKSRYSKYTSPMDPMSIVGIVYQQLEFWQSNMFQNSPPSKALHWTWLLQCHRTWDHDLLWWIESGQIFYNS